MNSKQMHDMLLGYPASIGTADYLKIQKERFVISNMDTSQFPGEHWVTFYFTKRGPYELFNSFEHMLEDYTFGFEKIINKKYLKNVGQLQQSTSDVCRLYRYYYMMIPHSDKTIKDIVKDFNNLDRKKQNDHF